jgi:hypothetical protein
MRVTLQRKVSAFLCRYTQCHIVAFLILARKVSASKLVKRMTNYKNMLSHNYTNCQKNFLPINILNNEILSSLINNKFQILKQNKVYKILCL